MEKIIGFYTVRVKETNFHSILSSINHELDPQSRPIGGNASRSPKKKNRIVKRYTADTFFN